MRATVWSGRNTVQVENVPDPEIRNPHDCILKITSTAICGSDLHLVDGYVPGMQQGDILGHEFMGEVVEVGKEVRRLKKGDRVVVPFPIACGKCWHCKHELYAACENSNPNAGMAEKLWGHTGAGLFGYSHITGGYAGGQAEYARVPFADVGPFKVDPDLTDDQALFLSDIFPTGFMGAEFCEPDPGKTIAVWGCGPVGQLTIASLRLLGCEHVIAIDRFPERLRLAKEEAGAEVVINYEEQPDVAEELRELTAGRGPDAVVDAVGLEGHAAHAAIHAYDRIKQAARLETERPVALREAIMSCAPGGIVSLIGVYGGLMDKFPVGAFINKGLQMRSGQTHVHRYLDRLHDHVRRGDIDPSFVISHHLSLDEAAHGYDVFKNKEESCTKVVLKP